MNRRAILATLGVAAGVMPFASAARAQTTVLSIASIPIDATAAVWYAADRGDFTKSGLVTAIQVMNNGGAIASAVASGAVDIGASNIVSLAEAHMRGVPFVIVAPAAVYSSAAPTSVLMVASNSPIKTARDLNGKTIGVTGLKTISQFAPMARIDQHGGNSAGAQYIEIPPSGLTAALSQGRVDAACMLEPFVSLARANARVLANCFDAVGSRFLLAVYFTTQTWASKNQETLRRFQLAVHDAELWANTNNDKSVAILEKYTNISADVARSMVRATYPDALTEALIQPVIDVTVKYGGGVTFPARELLLRKP
jgi:NitT/TauT family transport system substrate-binding protein